MRAQRLFTSLAALSFGILVSVFANWLSERWVPLLPWIAGIGLLAGVAGFVLTWRGRPPSTEALIHAPVTIRTPAEVVRYARRGFVGFVPIFTPKRGTAADKLPLAERQRLVEALDFDALQIEQSNLMPTIVAITTHGARLEHCWLLTTGGADTQGSRPYARLLAEYLRREKGLTCQFHYDSAGTEQTFTIPLDEDALVLSKTYDIVQSVLGEAVKLGVPARSMVADITTGFRSMTLGMILACLDRERDVEFIGTRYGPDGMPTGGLFPIIFSFEPVMGGEHL